MLQADVGKNGHQLDGKVRIPHTVTLYEMHMNKCMGFAHKDCVSEGARSSLRQTGCGRNSFYMLSTSCLCLSL